MIRLPYFRLCLCTSTLNYAEFPAVFFAAWSQAAAKSSPAVEYCQIRMMADAF